MRCSDFSVGGGDGRKDWVLGLSQDKCFGLITGNSRAMRERSRLKSILSNFGRTAIHNAVIMAC